MSDPFEPNNSEDLDSFLSSRPETVTQGYVQGSGADATAVLYDPATGAPASSDQGYAVPPGVVSQPQVASPPPAPAQPGVSQAEYEAALQAAEQQEQVNRALVRQQMELQEAIFESSINHLDEYSKQFYRQQRYLGQYADANEALAAKNRELEYGQEMREQAEAKQQVALIRMLKNGVNIADPQAKADILSAETSDQMNARVALWARVHNLSQQQMAAQATRAQVGAGAYAAAPQRGNSRGGSPSRSLDDYLNGQAFYYGE
jgi:hypothetical protein